MASKRRLPEKISDASKNCYVISLSNIFTHLKLCGTTVESLLTDTLNKGHCIKYLSTMDKTKSPNFNPPPINIMQLESLNSGQSLYNGQTT